MTTGGFRHVGIEAATRKTAEAADSLNPPQSQGASKDSGGGQNESAREQSRKVLESAPTPQTSRATARTAIALASTVVLLLIAVAAAFLVFRPGENGEAANVDDPPTTLVEEVGGVVEVADAEEQRGGADVASCADGGLLSGRWRFTTTVTGAARRALGWEGHYSLEFTRSGCAISARVQKLGFKSRRRESVFDSTTIQSGTAVLQDVVNAASGVTGALEVRLVRKDRTTPLQMRFRFVFEGSTLRGEYRYAGGSWSAFGMWGYLAGGRDATSQPIGGDLDDQPCSARCRIGCDAPRREADGLPPAPELADCVRSCETTASPSGCAVAPYRFDSETIGGVSRGATTREVTEAFGPPTTIGKPTLSNATGMYEAAWKYPGLRVVFEADPRTFSHRLSASNKWRVTSLQVRSLSKFRTSQGVGIGDPKAVVERAYGPWIEKGETSESAIVVGSIYGGLMFQLKAGVVSGIYLGHIAE